MKEQLEEIRRRAMAELGDDAGEAQIDAVRVRVLGRSGELTEIMRGMREVPNTERPAIGQLINQIKREVEARIEALSEKVKNASLTKSLNEKRLDVTLPGMRIARGHIHPITDILEKMLGIFESMGFEVAMTQDIEDDFHNFAALKFPAASSGARHAGHLLRRRRDAAADAYVERPDSRHGKTPAAARGRVSGAMLPARRPVACAPRRCSRRSRASWSTSAGVSRWLISKAC